jgi:integrase
VRIQPSGVRTYYVQLRRSSRLKIAAVGKLTPDEARERCQIILGNVAHGRAPLHGIDGTSTLTLGEFIKETYDPWLRANRPRSAAQSLQRLETVFARWQTTPMELITVDAGEKWKLERIQEGLKPSTILRDIYTLSSVLSHAVKRKKLTENVLRNVDKPGIDRSPNVRFLSQEESQRLRVALKERDSEMRKARESMNQWLKARQEPLLPKLGEFADHLEPAILISLNTGLRRGELLALKWTAVNFIGRTLTIEGNTSKSEQTRHIPLNAEALDVFKRWQKQSTEDRIFPFGSFKTAWSALLKRASITNFRWHDQRHDFASRLASKGVALNTIRELLGHGSLAMTLRYAHLAPDQKAAAVGLLGQL